MADQQRPRLPLLMVGSGMPSRGTMVFCMITIDGSNVQSPSDGRSPPQTVRTGRSVRETHAAIEARVRRGNAASSRVDGFRLRTGSTGAGRVSVVHLGDGAGQRALARRAGQASLPGCRSSSNRRSRPILHTTRRPPAGPASCPSGFAPGIRKSASFRHDGLQVDTLESCEQHDAGDIRRGECAE